LKFLKINNEFLRTEAICKNQKKKEVSLPMYFENVLPKLLFFCFIVSQFILEFKAADLNE
jgi:hypothetical protein